MQVWEEYEGWGYRQQIMRFKRIILIVLDSLGIGEMPDAAEYGDSGSDTLGHIAQQRQLRDG